MYAYPHYYGLDMIIVLILFIIVLTVEALC